jgi:transcriptional regulator with XRE-family HTH domain
VLWPRASLGTVTEGGSLGQRLAELRRSAEPGQEQLTRAAWVSVTTIGDIERGIALTLRADTLRRIDIALGLVGRPRQSCLAGPT